MLKFSFLVEYGVGETVFLKTDPEQLRRIVIGYRVDDSKIPFYILAHLKDESTHYGHEIARESNLPKVQGFKQQQ